MPWIFEPNADEQAALDEAEEELDAFFRDSAMVIPDRDRRGFGADRFFAKPDAKEALEIAWSDLVKKGRAPSLPATLVVVGTVRRENPFTDHKFTLSNPN